MATMRATSAARFLHRVVYVEVVANAMNLWQPSRERK